jgi:DNA repair protein RadD
MELRPYQLRVIDSLWSWFGRNDTGHPLVEAAVGSGKSVMIAALARRALSEYQGTRLLMVVASRELCGQNLDKLLRVWPEAPAGVHSAGLGRKDIGHDVLFATIGSVFRKAHLLGRVDLLLVDECHNINPAQQGMYRQLIGELARYNPAMRVIGWTGTAYRGDGIWLTDAVEPLFTDVAARVPMRELLDAGYLAPLVTAPVEQILHADGVRMSGGDYVVSALAEKIDQVALVEACAGEIVRLGAGRRRWLVYGVTVEHARHITAALQALGVRCALLHAGTPSGERDAIITQFRDGHLQALVNVAVLTTGFDVPEVDLIALMRNTRSPVLYVQIAGRGMRTAAGKTDCLWLDFTDTTSILGPVDRVRGRARPTPRRGDGDAAAPRRICDECGAYSPAAALVCVCCGAQFPVVENPRHRDRVSLADVLSRPAAEPATYDVTDVHYARHEKPGSPPSLRVEYWSGLRRVASEWICIEHTGWAREKALGWWARRSGGSSPPRLVNEALDAAGVLRRPARIVVNESGRWPEIVRVHWDDENRTRDEGHGRQELAA